MLVTGFPTPDQPANGIFNLRAAKMLSESVDIKVIHLRAWKPRRRIIEFSNGNGVPVLTVTVPQVPFWERLNLPIYRTLGWPSVRPLLEECDLIHSVDLGFAGVLGSAWGKRAGVRHVTQVIADVRSCLQGESHFHSATKWQNQMHGVACNSRLLAKQLSDLFPNVPNIHTVYRGVDLEVYRPEGPVVGTIADRPPVRFLYLGGFPAYPRLTDTANTKGGETLLKAWEAADEPLVSAGASLCIAGPDSNTARVASWRARLRRPDRVHVAGALHPEAVPEYLRASDVVLVPSMEEGLPNVAVEASACGRPVFGSDVGGIPEVVVNEETGLVLPAGNVAAWTNALATYAEKVDKLRGMGVRARHRMEIHFNAKNYGPSMLDLYAAAMNEPAVSRDGPLESNTRPCVE